MIKNVLSYFVFSLILVGSGCSSGGAPDGDDLNIDVILSSESILYNGVETSFSAAFSDKIDEAVYYFNGSSVGSMIAAPYTVKFTPMNLPPGEYNITCIAKVGGKSFNGENIAKVVLRLGDAFQGGKIFKLDESGKKGLIASASDLVYSGNFGDEVRFVWGSDKLLGTNLTDGKANTKLMADAAVSSGFAGYNFKGAGLSMNGFSDWYIPSINELELLKENKAFVGGFSAATDWQSIYWSSSETNESEAFLLNFNALMGNYDNKSKVFKIRPIRRFDF